MPIGQNLQLEVNLAGSAAEGPVHVRFGVRSLSRQIPKNMMANSLSTLAAGTIPPAWYVKTNAAYSYSILQHNELQRNLSARSVMKLGGRYAPRWVAGCTFHFSKKYFEGL